MEKEFELFSKVIEALHNRGVLKKLVLIGSWCTTYYRGMFENHDEIPALRTSDIDFMIPSPHGISKKVNVHEILIQLGFDPNFQTMSGLVKYEHPILDIEFLTPELGKGQVQAYEIKPFSINAVGLRFLELLQRDIIEVSHNDIMIKIPSPESFALHKFIICHRRKNDEKAKKDIVTAKAILDLCLNSKKHRKQLITIFSSLPGKWQN
jgi:hypothetical protein